jgi:polygalacturonase
MKLIRLFLYLLLSALLVSSTISCAENQQNKMGWENVDEILKEVIPPKFPDRTISILDLGAKNDGVSDCLGFIKTGIDSLESLGGGVLLIPAGDYLVGGPIHLKSNVNLHLAEGSKILFSTNPEDYLPVVFTRWEGVECYNYSALVYAYKQTNIAITGLGTLHGQGSDDNWWSWKGKKEYSWKEGMPNQKADRDLLMQMNNNKVDVKERIFGDGHYLRPNFIQFYECNNILMEDFTVKDSPMWIIHPVLSENITVRRVKSVGSGPNNDGLDPESSKNILIEDCYFDNGDDCIAIKSGRNNDGRRINVASENIVVRNCKMKDGHGGIVLGSEISGGVKNVFLENCEMDSPSLDRAIRIKTNIHRGGIIENLFVRNVTVGEVGDAVIRINMNYDPKETSGGGYLPVIRNINISNVTSKKSNYGLRLEGLENSFITDITVTDCTFNGAKKGNIISMVKDADFKNVITNDELLQHNK